jgi:ubiquinone biosynthesis protein
MLASLLRWLAEILWMRIWGKLSTDDFAVRLRIYLEKMGGLWIKVGQLLSLRRDLFSQTLCKELSRLLDQTTGFEFEVARKIIERDLGGPLEQFFDEFEEEPFAAASIGQTYRARLRFEKVWVAVKVQRPTVQFEFNRQMVAIKLVARWVEWLHFMPNLRPTEIISELEHIISDELDYRMEGSNIRRMRKSLREHGIYVPKAFTQYCAPHVLVMEFIQGVLMSDYIQVHATDREKTIIWEKENQVDPTIVGRRLYHSLLRQIFEDNLFHGDLHPGNIILLRNSRVAFIDFGTIGSMESDYQRKYQLFLRSVATQEYSKAVDLIFLLASTLPPIDLQELKEECIRILRRWEARTVTKGLPYHEKSVSIMYQQMLLLLNKHQVRPTWLFLKIDRAALTLDASLMHLLPEADFPKLLRSYFERAEERQLILAAKAQASGQAIAGAMSLATIIPEMVYEYRMFQAPMLRRHAVSYQGSLTKLDRLFGAFFSLLSLVAFVVLVGLLLVFLYQYYPAWIISIAGDWVVRIGEVLPHFSVYVWIAILLIQYYSVFRVLVKLKKRFSEQEIRLPEP